MAFANFFVSEGEITKQYKGCYRNTGKSPEPGDRGTMSGEWISPSPVTNIIPIAHATKVGLYIYPAQQGGWVKMVGIQYGGPQGPVRVDGRAYSPIVSLNSENITNAWNNAQDKGLSSSQYNLKITNETQKIPVSECLNEANKKNESVFSVSNLTKNNMAQCLTGSQVNENESSLIKNPDPFVNESINESDCLKMSNANTVYTINYEGPNSKLLGQTYMGQKNKDTGKMTYYKYPNSMISLGTNFTTMDNYSSGEDIAGLTSITDATPEKCKQLCVNAGQNCQGFVYEKNNQTCNLKSKIYPYNNTSREQSNNNTIYTRLPEVKNDSASGCPVNVKPVSSKFLETNGNFSNEPMTMEFPCSDVQSLENKAIKNIADLDNESLKLGKDINGLQEKNNELLKGFEEVQTRFKNQVGEYETLNKNMKQLVDNPTASQMLRDMNSLSESFSMRNTGIMMVFVLLAIIGLRVFKK